MRYNCSWNNISNVLNFFRSVNLKEISCKGTIDRKYCYIRINRSLLMRDINLKIRQVISEGNMIENQPCLIQLLC